MNTVLWTLHLYRIMYREMLEYQVFVGEKLR